MTEREQSDARMGEALELISFPEFIRGQILRAGVELGLFDVLDDEPTSANTIAEELGLDHQNSYRLLRALAAVGVLNEDTDRRFSLTPVGEYFQPDHPQSLQAPALLFGNPGRMSAWSHLPDIVREGERTGYEREFGRGFFKLLDDDPELADIFNETMTRFSQLSAPGVLSAFDRDEFSEFSHVCDVAGGHGYLLCHLLEANPHLEGTVLELESVVEEQAEHWAPKLGVENRCTYLAGDMFEEVPGADAYVMKSVLHDWPDEDCVEILSTIRESAPPEARLFIVERLVPPPGETQQFVPMDINMMVGVGGRERTETEFKELLVEAGWVLTDARESEGDFSIIEATNP